MFYSYSTTKIKKALLMPTLATVIVSLLNSSALCDEAKVVLPSTASSAEILKGFLGDPSDPKTRRVMQLAGNSCPSGRTVAMNIPFGYDSAQLTPEAEKTLIEVAKAMGNAALASCGFYIEGHTDAKGKFAYNVSLSSRRADTVQTRLANLGMDKARLVAIGMGPRQPINAANPYAEENRRVEFRTR